MSLTLHTPGNIDRALQYANNGYDVSQDKFYDKVLLDTIQLGEEHNVYTSYSEPARNFEKGTNSIQMRRWGSLTPHTVPLVEGMPPNPDKTSMESITFTTTQFGRYMAFSDRVDFTIIDPVVSHYMHQYGIVAKRTFERYAREEMLSSATSLFPAGRTTEGELELGDVITIFDLRIQVLRMKRQMVKPRPDGKFHFITSDEVIFDFVDDATVRDYMSINQSTYGVFDTGQIPDMFDMHFVSTMLDDFYTPELDNAGEWHDGSEYKLRVFKETTPGNYIYGNIAEASRTVVTNKYLNDGSAVPRYVKWDIEGGTVNKDGGGVESGAGWKQLPIHRSLLLGKDALVETGINGHTGVQTFVKAKGSAGTSDPLDQVQTIGFKIDSVGFGILREEACVVVFSVPSRAAATQDLMAAAKSLENSSIDANGDVIDNALSDASADTNTLPEHGGYE